ncbi:MAG: hypothetical protein ACLQJR_05720 [Stellaceae bacterium]
MELDNATPANADADLHAALIALSAATAETCARFEAVLDRLGGAQPSAPKDHADAQ